MRNLSFSFLFIVVVYKKKVIFLARENFKSALSRTEILPVLFHMLIPINEVVKGVLPSSSLCFLAAKEKIRVLRQCTS